MAKSRLLIFLLCLSAEAVLGQSYEKFVDTNKVWHIFYECSGPCPPMWDHYRRYYFQGDTLIDSISYNKFVGEVLIRDYNSSSTTITVDSAYEACYIREDTALQKVFIYYDERYWWVTDPYEGVLYDFRVNLGDTVWLGHDIEKENPIIVNSVSHIKLNNDQTVKKIELHYSSYYWIEGIGGFKYRIDPSLQGLSLDPPGITCVRKGDFVIYGDYCFQIVNTHNIEGNGELTLYPNPVNDNLFLKSPLTTAALVFIYNSNGNLVMNFDLAPFDTRINVNELGQGLYYIMILMNQKLVHQDSFLKIN